MELLKAQAKTNIKASGMCVTDLKSLYNIQKENLILITPELTPFQAQALPSNVIGVILPYQMASSHCTIVLKYKKVSVFLSDAAFKKIYSGDFAALNPYTSTICVVHDKVSSL